MRAKCMAGWLVVAGLTIATGVGAQNSAPDADRLKTAADEFDAGRRAYKLKDFENAAGHFETADRDAPSAEALVSAIRARKEAQQMARAATLSALAQTRYPHDKAVADLASQIIGSAGKSLHKVSLTCTPDCAIIVDKKVAPFPEGASAVVYVDPGSHTFMATWPGKRESSKELAATAGGSSQLAFTAPPANGDTEPASKPRYVPVPFAGSSSSSSSFDSSTEPPLPPPRSGLPIGVFVTGAVLTAVLGGVTVWSGIDTQNNPGPQRVQDECVDTDCALYQDGLAKQNRTNALIAGTAVAGAATIVVAFFTKWGGSRGARGSAVLPVVSIHDGAVIGATGRF